MWGRGNFLRVIFKFHPEKPLVLPIHYNHLIQAAIYRNLDTKLAEWLHLEGYSYGKRQYKFFTFSRIIASKRRYDPHSRNLHIEGEFSLKVASPNIQFLESLATNLVKKGHIKVHRQVCVLLAAEVEMPIEVSGPVIVRALSPIVTYTTMLDSLGRRKTYYYSPWEDEFAEKIFDNLQRKWVALYGENKPISIEKAYIKPVKVNKHNEAIVKFKETVIKGWTGIYELYLPSPWFELAYDSGLGSKNSQGFGMVEVVKKYNDG